MSWRDRLRPASFRGVEFFVESHESGGGRRGATHEYPQRDEPYAEDTGRKARTFVVDGYLVGADYDRARDLLIKALEEAGPGELVHPYLGTHRVIAREYTVRETTRDGGMVFVRVSFEEAGRNAFPSSPIDTVALVDAAGIAADVTTEAAFSTAIDHDAPGWLAAATSALVVAATEAIEAELPKATALSGDLDTLRRDLLAMRSTAPTAVLTPATLASDLVALLAAVRGLPSDANEGLRMLLGLAGFAPSLDTFPQTTPFRVLQARNEAATLALVRRAAVSQAARAATAIRFDSRPSARAAREELANALDAEITAAADLGDDEVYQGLSDLYAATVRDLTERGASLADVQRVTLPASQPALVVAYRLYQDASRDAEIVARNPVVRHPGLVPGDVELEVLTVGGG